MTTEADLDRDPDAIADLLYRLRPGDEVTVVTNRSWSDGRTMKIWKVEIKELSDGEDYYRIFAKGPRQQHAEKGGDYILMPEKPAGKGSHPAPEGYHRTPNPEAAYKETTGGAILQVHLAG